MFSQTYLGKSEGKNEFKENRGFNRDDTRSKIILKTDDVPMQMKVGENQLWMLDANGNLIECDLAEMYILKKKVE